MSESSGRYGSDYERMRAQFFREQPPPPWPGPPPLHTDPPEYDYYRQFREVVPSASTGYGCLGFIFDCVMVCVTGGFWFIWIFVREMRRAFPRKK